MSLLTTKNVLLAAIALRVVFFYYGLYQDATMALRYTDIDYYVFTDAARFMANGLSPYERETYRYTPLLAWLLQPTTYWFSFGKAVFAAGDIVAGYAIIRVLKMQGVSDKKAALYSTVWLLNPMVATISTRGSSEGLLGALIALLLWAVYAKQWVVAGFIAGFSVHFKIYPIIYIPTIIWAMNDTNKTAKDGRRVSFVEQAFNFFTKERLLFGFSSALTFIALFSACYHYYGHEFLQHTYLHHLSRTDHRHNFSPYSTLLYMVSSKAGQAAEQQALLPPPQTWAFLPQLLLSGIILPLSLAKISMVKTMFLQTFVFVTFNKVCTSQYFMWYIVLLPFYFKDSKLLSPGRKVVSITFALLWVAAQALWIQQGYALEFLGQSTYMQLCYATLGFFVVNCFGIVLLVGDL